MCTFHFRIIRNSELNSKRIQRKESKNKIRNRKRRIFVSFGWFDDLKMKSQREKEIRYFGLAAVCQGKDGGWRKFETVKATLLYWLDSLLFRWRTIFSTMHFYNYYLNIYLEGRVDLMYYHAQSSSKLMTI